MDIKPIISGEKEDNKKFSIKRDETNNMENLEIKTKSLPSNVKKTLDPYGVIPNGIFKVFVAEKRIKKFNILFFITIFFVSLTTSLLFAFAPSLFQKFLKDGQTKIVWGWYIIPSILGVLSFIALIFDAIELNGIRRSVEYYREQINQGISFTPPFVINLYEKLMRKQVRRTWLVVAIIFYLGLFTLTFWGLKDKKWGALDFNKWIHSSFSNPDLIVYVLCCIILGVLVLFIIGSISRKKRMVDIQMFFGNEVMNYNELAKERSNAHKYWSKVFFISVLVSLVLPIIILLIVKRIVRKKV
ncbi:MSC_0882 family membrane protein [Metamycoplasma canadense]|uniref:Uncharacterized protein n=1 Tax=Metamycoplasma canadense TaxID=29554 RepID=A0A077LBI1_9BACT|nr:hypothetical protein [Metamycoplasma canadense]BAP39484.1 hypothetical protein MCAN360_0261 [Metamycoplasma canadense]